MHFYLFFLISIKWLPSQDGGVGRVLISCESTKIVTRSWTTIDKRMLEPTKKDTPCPKTKKKPQQDDRRGTITVKSNSISAGWVTHSLENNAKEVLALLWRFWTPHQASQPGDLTKGLGIPRESDLEDQWDLIVGLPEDWGKQRLQSWGAQIKFCMHQDPQKRSSDPIAVKTTC